MGKQALSIFERVEKKYLLTKSQYTELVNRMKDKIKPDNYTNYTICNIYFDTHYYDLIRESIEKPQYKEKLRLRSYGVPKKGDQVYLELKKKCESIVYKRRIGTTLLEAQNYLKHKEPLKKDTQIVHELNYFMQFHEPEPKLFLAYDRSAFCGIEDEDLRITFDFNLRSRTYDLSLETGDYGDMYFKEAMVLMEIKVLHAFPLWLVDILSDMKIYPTSFSKYGNIYKKDIAESLRRNFVCLPVY